MLRRPPHILVTTPESLYLLLTAAKSRERCCGGRHGDRRRDSCPGARQAGQPPGAVARAAGGPVATAAGADRAVGHAAADREIARFLVGAQRGSAAAAGERDCAIVDAGHVRELDLAIEVPPSELSAVCSNEQWGEIYARLTELVAAHRSTLSSSTRGGWPSGWPIICASCWAKRPWPAITAAFRARFASRPKQRLKAGELQGDRGHGLAGDGHRHRLHRPGLPDRLARRRSPRSCSASAGRDTRWARFPRGGCFRCRATSCSSRWPWCGPCAAGHLDAIEIPDCPLDILAQQIVASVACEEWDEDDAVRAVPAGVALSRAGAARLRRDRRDAQRRHRPAARRGAYLHRDRIHGRLRARRRRGWRRSLPAGRSRRRPSIAWSPSPRERSSARSTRISRSRAWRATCFCWATRRGACCTSAAARCVVRDAEGAPPSIPFWLGERPGRTNEFSAELSRLRGDIARAVGRQRDQLGGDGRLAGGRVRGDGIGRAAGARLRGHATGGARGWCRRRSKSSSSGSSTNRGACNW